MGNLRKKRKVEPIEIEKQLPGTESGEKWYKVGKKLKNSQL